jgi:hypothetical protein
MNNRYGSGISIPEDLPMVGPPSDENQIAAFFSAWESDRGFSNLGIRQGLFQPPHPIFALTRRYL